MLPGTLTVYEYLLFNASLRLPARLVDPPEGPSEQERLQGLVGQVIRELGLAKVAHSFIGDAFVRGLSGEEGWRLGVGRRWWLEGVVGQVRGGQGRAQLHWRRAHAGLCWARRAGGWMEGPRLRLGDGEGRWRGGCS